jgi:hypothetical protein
MIEETKNVGHILKVVSLGIQDKVYEAMKQPRFSVEALTRRLNTEGIDITAQSIRKFIKKTKKAQSALIARDLKTSHELAKVTMNYTKALKDILTEVEDMKNAAKEEKDLTTYNQLVGRIYQGIELLAKMAGDIKPKGAIDIKVIYNEIDTDVENKMKKIKNEFFKQKALDVDAEIMAEDKKAEEKLNK